MDEPREPDITAAARRLLTICHECAGVGARGVWWSAHVDDRHGAIMLALDCSTCDSVGAVPGLVPPV